MKVDHTVLDEVYERLHRTGPEFRGWLSNHGPMAAEAMIRRGHGERVQNWLDGYVRRLEPFPRPTGPIGSDWQEALGDVRRVADWTQYFQKVLAEQPWRTVLNVWWPRLLPGIAAGATHGVIRVGHAVRGLIQDGESPLRLQELAHGLAYWSARWQPVMALKDYWDVIPEGESDSGVDGQLAAIPRLMLPHEGLSFHAWITRVADIPGWVEATKTIAIPPEPAQVRSWLDQLVEAAVVRYLWYGHGDEIMLVHAVTAPNAVSRILPALHHRWWRPSAFAAWVAVAALTAIYTPDRPVDSASLPLVTAGPNAAEDAFARAVAHGDEHIIKFADTALDVYARTHDRRALAAIYRAADLITP